ncbi:MAG TPA: xanthine dehydrogenase family protein molybdopterin-binding subunit [Lapillicoccus sp.]|nr:xanthine dehydrogenase family protein molybdopterin-binding subunit [Lapillicoccus sp.]
MTAAPAAPATAPTRLPDRVAPPADAGPWVGRPVDRADGAAKATGAATYSAEYPFPDIAHAVLVHATIARGRIRSIGTALAEAHPGVVAVLTHRNAPTLAPAPSRVNLMDLSTMAAGSRVPYLNTDEVFYDGQPVAVVVADRLEAAQYAASLVDIDYERLPAHVDFATEQHRAAPVKQSLGMPTLIGRKGDAGAALASAPCRVDLRFTTPTQNHNAMEPHSTTAVWDGDRLTVWDSSQNIDWVRRHLALRFGVPGEQVRVLAPFVGGGFGGKSNVWSGTLLTVMAARSTGRPVRLAMTREGVHRTVGGRSPTTQRVALGATADGGLTALVHEAVMRTSPMGGSADQVVGASGDLYDAPAIALHSAVVELDLVPNTSMRAPGESVGSFAMESAMDQLAHDLGLDPVDLRLRNEPDVSPMHGKAFSHRRIREAMQLGAHEFGWRERRPTHTGSTLVGYGMALAYHPSWLFVANVVLSLDADGSATLRCGFHEIGTGTGTVLAQVVADELGVPFDAVRVEYGDTDLPIAPGAGGSAQSASVVGSIAAAAARVRRQVRRWGGRDGEPLADALRRTGHDRVEVSVGADSGMRAVAGQARFIVQTLRDQRRWVRAASGAHFCEVHVDRDTGEVRVARWVAAFDVGTVLNAKTLASQLRGGIVMGLGLALTEETVIDPRTGRIMSATLADYHVPVHADVPDIAVHVLDDPDPSMPKGVVGAGEVGITGVGAAVANAVYDATGVRVTDLPITLDKVVRGR